MGEPITATWYNRPTNYAVPLPRDIENRIREIPRLPQYIADDDYYSIKFDSLVIEITSISGIYYIGTRNVNTDFPEIDSTEEMTFIDGNDTIFVQNRPFNSEWVTLYTAKPGLYERTNNISEDSMEMCIREYTFPGRFFSKGSSGYLSQPGGSAALNITNRTYYETAVAAYVNIKYNAIRYYKGKKVAQYTVNGLYNLELLLYHLSRPDVNVTNRASCNKFDSSLCANLYFRNVHYMYFYNSFMLWKAASSINLSNAQLDAIYTSVADIEVPSRGSAMDWIGSVDSSYYSMWSRLIFIDTVSEFDNLPSKSLEELEELEREAQDVIVDIDEPYKDGGTSGENGGGGSFGEGESSDDIVVDLPEGSAEQDMSNAGLFTRYLMNQSTTKAFGDWLWSDNIIDTVVKEFMSIMFGSPMEAIISMMSYPFSIASLSGVETSAANVFYGNKDSGVASLGKITGGYASIDWGTIFINEFWGNFLDYAPHTRIELYLPWCTGFVDVNPNDVMDGFIGVKTNIELDKGTCVHNVYNHLGSIIGQYSGVCGKQLPVTALDTSGKALALVTSAVAAAVGAGAAAVGAGAASSAGIAAANTPTSVPWTAAQQMSALKSAESATLAKYEPIKRAGTRVAAVSSLAAFRTPAHIQRSGSFSGNNAGMGIQYPYIILSRPTQSVPKNYGNYVGYPSNIYTRLGSVRGYTEVGSIHLNGINCTEKERAEIDALLKGGVIL